MTEDHGISGSSPGPAFTSAYKVLGDDQGEGRREGDRKCRTWLKSGPRYPSNCSTALCREQEDGDELVGS